MEEDIKVKETKGKRAYKKFLIVGCITAILLVLTGLLVFILYETGQFKKIENKKIVSNQVFEEAKVLKTYDFELGSYRVITKETEENKDGKIIKNEDVYYDYDKEIKFVLLEKGLYKVELLEGGYANIDLMPYRETETSKEDVPESYTSIILNNEYSKINEIEISEEDLQLNILPENLSDENVKKSDVKIRFSLLDREVKTKTDKKGTEYEITQFEEDNYYEVGKNIPEGVYDIEFTKGKLADFVIMNNQGTEIFKSTFVKNESINKTFLSNFELKEGNRIQINELYKTTKLQERYDNESKFVLTALNTETELVEPKSQSEGLRSSKDASEVKKTYELEKGKYLLKVQGSKDPVLGEYDNNNEYKKIEIEKGIYNIELIDGIFANVEIIEYGYEGVDISNDKITFMKNENGSNLLRLTERELNKAEIRIIVSTKDIPAELTNKENNIKIKLSLLDKKEIDQTTANNGKQYTITQKLDNKVYEVGKDIDSASYDMELIDGYYSLITIKNSKGLLKQESYILGRTEKNSRQLLKDIILEQGDTISIKAVFWPGPLYQPRNFVKLLLTAR